MRFALAIVFAAFLAVPATAQTAPERMPEPGKFMVDITYKDSIERILSRVNRVEQIKEERFRKYRHTERTHRDAGIFRHSKTLTEGTRWANETLIPKLEDYTVTNLLRALTADNINRAVPDFDGTINYEINRFKVANHEVAILSGVSSYMTGRVTLIDSDGKLRQSEKVSANLVVDPSVDRQYTGPKYAFLQTDPEARIGPTISYFVEKALERLWPEKEDEIHGPVVIRVSGPNERVLQ